uniref:Putative secreted protein n=1 Tax=Ixodes ricinus TaxID=34613 RepID=A0A6B0TV94_IXORI
MLDRGAGPGIAPIARHVRWGGVQRRLLLLAVIRWPVLALLQGVGAQFGQQIVVGGGARLGLVDLDLSISKGSPK